MYTAADPDLLYGRDNSPQLIHTAIFNAPGIGSNLFTSSHHKLVAKIKDSLTSSSSSKMEGDDKRFIQTEYVVQPYAINGDTVAGLRYYANTRWHDELNGNGKHTSTNFVATKVDEQFREWFSTGTRLDKPFLTLDTDNDGILDVDELGMNTDYKKLDTDNDGWGDKIEIVSNTNPDAVDNHPDVELFYDVSFNPMIVANQGAINPQTIMASLSNQASLRCWRLFHLMSIKLLV